MEFIGRTRELAVLEAAFTSEGSAFIPIYGRRRVGKSELILRSLRDRPALYLVGKRSNGPLQLRELLREAARVLDEPLLAELPDDDWRRALLTVTERWPEDHKMILAFDEFQWTAGAVGELTSVLQELWDRFWKRSGRVVLILCGSMIGFMEREVLGKGSPLFGRRTARIHLRPFGFREAGRFHPSYSVIDRARSYFVCGGVPAYLLAFDQERSFEHNIRNTLLDELSPLAGEPDFLLREELRDVENYYAVLMAIAAGNSTAKTIAKEASVPERNLHYYLQQLSELGYVARRYPLTEDKPAKRHVRFALEDPLLRFWFRFIFPNQSFLDTLDSQRGFREIIAPHLDSFCGTAFERLCREALPLIYINEGVNAAFEVGEYWAKDVQIDVVGLRQDNWTDLGECKWGKVEAPKAVIDELEGRIVKYPNRRGATLGRRYFLRDRPARGFPRGRGKWYDLQDLYAL